MSNDEKSDDMSNNSADMENTIVKNDYQAIKSNNLNLNIDLMGQSTPVAQKTIDYTIAKGHRNTIKPFVKHRTPTRLRQKTPIETNLNLQKIKHDEG